MPRKPQPSPQRYALTLDSGREFIIYAPTGAVALQRLAEAAYSDSMVYEGAAKPVMLKSLGFVKNIAKCPIVKLPPAQEGPR